MEKFKKQLQNIWENLAYQAKNNLKSASIANFLQIFLLILPLWLKLISFYYNRGDKCTWCTWLDYFSFFISILAIVYYAYFWRNTELYREYGEKYLTLYKEVERIYKEDNNNADLLKDVQEKQVKLNEDLHKPMIHIWIKWYIDKTIEEEFKYANEDVVWWKRDK